MCKRNAVKKSGHMRFIFAHLFTTFVYYQLIFEIFKFFYLNNKLVYNTRAVSRHQKPASTSLVLQTHATRVVKILAACMQHALKGFLGPRLSFFTAGVQGTLKVHGHKRN